MVTDKSWKLLQTLQKELKFVLIGGWAVYLWTRALKSKDIDLVLDYEELEKLKGDFEVVKNERLKKYEAKRSEIEIDIYIPFYSNPGLPAEEIKNFVVSLEGFQTVAKEALAVVKQKAFSQRRDSVKGRKDLIDLMSLFQLEGFDWNRYLEIIAKYEVEDDLELVKKSVKETRQIEEIGLNVHKMAALKKKILTSARLKGPIAQR